MLDCSFFLFVDECALSQGAEAGVGAYCRLDLIAKLAPPGRTGPNSPWPHGGGNKMERKALMKSGTSGRMWASGPTFL